MDSYSHLEHQLVDLVQQIKYHAKHQHLNRHSQIRVDQWLKKITQVTVNTLWKKQRNTCAQALLLQVQQGKLAEPFSKVPPEGPLNNIALPKPPSRPVSRPVSRPSSRPVSRPPSRPGSVKKGNAESGLSDHLANEHYMKYLRKSSSQSIVPNKSISSGPSFLGSARREQDGQVYQDQLNKAHHQIDSLHRQNQIMRDQLAFKDEQYISLMERVRALEQGRFY